MNGELECDQQSAADIVAALLNELSVITEYRTLRDTLPRRLASLLSCRCVLLYVRIGETLQLVSGAFDDKPGWSSGLLAVAHINPIGVQSELPEARAWRERQAIVLPQTDPTLLAVPLIYRQRAIGVMVASRSREYELVTVQWQLEERRLLEAVAAVVALLLENTRLLEQDRERIHELSLLNSISSQLNCSLYEMERLRSVVTQRTREIASVDLCELIEVGEKGEATEAVSWLPVELRQLLFRHFQYLRTLEPFIFERSDPHSHVAPFQELLPADIKTLFALPLSNGRTIGKPTSSLWREGPEQEPCIFGLIVGAYHTPWKLRPTELTLLQVLASQASAVLENVHLMEDVVAARNEARKLLRQVLDEQRMHELILESIPSGLITTDMQGRINTFNRAAEAILGYHPYEVLGQSLHKFLDLRSAFVIPYTLTYSGEVQHGTVSTVDRYDRQLVLDVDIRPLCDELGARIGILATFSDMTLLHRLEEEKRRLDRLASLGEMAANVAHEVRNPLASIKTSIQMIRDDLLAEHNEAPPPGYPEQSDWIQESVAVVLKEVERLDTIVHDLLLFARPRQLHRSHCDLVEISDQVLTLMQSQFSDVGVVVHRIYEEIPTLWADTDQIEQVLLNLYTNALQAMSDGGILSVSCRAIQADSALREREEGAVPRSPLPASLSATLVRQQTLRAQQWVELLVSDTGSGIAPDQVERIFQPFYTTKAHGIGLGLSITRRLIEDHGGYIRVQSQLGYGATMIVRLPVLTDTTTAS